MAVDTNFNLRQRLRNIGITQVAFADMIDVDPTTVRTWVRIGTPGPTRRLIEMMEYEAGLSRLPHWLLPILSANTAAAA